MATCGTAGGTSRPRRRRAATRLDAARAAATSTSPTTSGPGCRPADPSAAAPSAARRGTSRRCPLVLAHHAHLPEPDRRVAADRLLVVRRRVDRDAVVPAVVEQVPHDQLDRLAAEAAALRRRPRNTSTLAWRYSGSVSSPNWIRPTTAPSCSTASPVALSCHRPAGRGRRRSITPPAGDRRLGRQLGQARHVVALERT